MKTWHSGVMQISDSTAVSKTKCWKSVLHLCRGVQAEGLFTWSKPCTEMGRLQVSPTLFGALVLMQPDKGLGFVWLGSLGMGAAALQRSGTCLCFARLAHQHAPRVAL
jgi:hypothetical protein